MGLFGKKNNKDLVSSLMKENAQLRKRNKELVDLCEEKDSYFVEMISDGLRHGSRTAAKHMADRRESMKQSL